MKTIIDVKEFTFKYPNKEQIILDKINLEVNEGECCVLLGSNGSGKTTLIKCILGELNGNGEMTVAGFLPNIYNNMFKQKIGVVLDNDILPDYLTLKEYLFFVGKCYKIENKLLNDKINTIISQFGLKGNEDNLLRYFSHGMRKKAQIIAAIIHDPKILVIDEPTNGLDVEMIYHLKKVLLELANKGVTILITTHILSFAESISNKILVIINGKVYDKLSYKDDKKLSLEERYIELLHETKFNQ